MKKIVWKSIFICLFWIAVGFGHEVTHHAPKRGDTDLKSYHLSMAAYYDQKAKEMGFIISIHEEMKESNGEMAMNRTDIPVGPGRTLERKTQNIESGMLPDVHLEMEKHCKAIIKDAERLKNDYEEAARWNREQAKELEKSKEEK